MCGEKVRTAGEKVLTRGSPQHVRGKELNLVQFFDRGRITPACAGKRAIADIILIGV